MKQHTTITQAKYFFICIIAILVVILVANYLSFYNPHSSVDEIVLILNLFIFSGISWSVRRRIIAPLRKITQVTQEIVNGNHELHIDNYVTPEYAVLSQSIDTLRQELHISEQIIANIEGGAFEKNKSFVEHNHFRLINALQRMQQKLQDVAIEDSRRNWVSEGLAQFVDILRTNTADHQALAELIISTLIRYLNANQGGLFVVNDDNQNDIHLEMLACYAYERKKYLKKRINIGEGLIGQAYLEKDTIFLTDIPTEYVHITSGLGKATPTCLLIVPLKTNDLVEGVIELASFHVLQPYEIEFVEKLAESIASSITSAKMTGRTHKLLEETRVQTEALRSQEEEMRQNMEEMQATQDEMHRMQFKSFQNEANLQAIINCTDDSVTAIDLEYRVILMNDVLRCRYANSQYKDFNEGVCVLDYLGEVRDVWKVYYDRALNGEKYDFVLKSSVHGENSYRHYFLGPIMDQSAQITGAYVFSRDVTKEKSIEVAYENLQAKLQEIA